MGGKDTFHHLIAINRAIATRQPEQALRMIVSAAVACCDGAEGAALLLHNGSGWYVEQASGLPAPAGGTFTGDTLPHAALGYADEEVIMAVRLEPRNARPAALVVYGKRATENATAAEVVNALADQVQIVAESGIDGQDEPQHGCHARRRALQSAEEALAETEHERRKLEVAMQAAPAGILLVESPSMRVVYANELARRMCTDLDFTRPIGAYASRFRKPDGSAYDPDEMPGIRALNRGESIRNEEMVFLSPGGEQRIFEVNASPARIDYSAVSYAVVAMQDITERKAVETRINEGRRTLEMRTRHLRRVNEELQQFAYVVSHDLKAPLRAVSNLATWIEEDIGADLAPENRKQMDLLRSRVKRMDTLINALLEYSRAGRVTGPTEATETGALVREVANSMSIPRPFVIEIAPDMPVIETDRLHLSQVFANLISNAIKHHDHPDEGRIKISARDLDKTVEFTVEDNGPGIAPQYHDKVFEMFQSLDGERRSENTGMGLALIRKLVENSGGDIYLESEQGRGATFRFTWPKHPSGDE